VRVLKISGRLLVVLALVTAATGSVGAQSSIGSYDVQRLQDRIYEVSRDVSQARSRDTTLASQLEGQLDDARDEAIYLKVKLRKNEPVSSSEYARLRDEVEDIGSRARGNTAGRYTPPSGTGSSADRDVRQPRRTTGTNATRDGEVPVGTEFDVRLQNTLSSGTANVEDRFEATTLVDVIQNDRVVVPAGSALRGVVSSVNKAGRVERKGSMTVAFDQITIRGRSYPTHATVEQALESEGIRGETAKIGTGAGVGAIIGGILGGVKVALAGILIDGGGTIAATEGKDVELPAGTVLRVRLDSPIALR